jgi:inhibitor of cysteine peptidase
MFNNGGYMKKIKNSLNIVFYLLIISLFVMMVYGINNLINTKNFGEIQNPTNYKDIYNVLKDISKRSYNGFFTNKGQEIAVEDSANKYSDTNLQVLGVQEADIIKTDGEYIFAFANNQVYIIKATDGNMDLVSTIKDDKLVNSNVEMYIYNDRLILINSTYYFGFRDLMYSYNATETGAIIYDISDHSNPIKLNYLSQKGSYISSRMVNNYLYLVTNYYVNNDDYKLEDYEDYIPMLYNKEYKSMNVEDIYIVPNPNSSQYVVVSSIDVNEPDDFINNKAVLGAGSNLYADTQNIIMASYDSVTEGNTVKSMTNLMRFSIADGIINLKASGKVEGNILNQFSMDIHNNYFRIVTTSYEYKQTIFYNDSVVSIDQNGMHNNLYILDMDLKVIGEIEDIAKDERVYSVRFDKDYAYFVTFKQVDPLFSVDLTDPSNPKILGALKIPGFSQYLHVYSNNLLFGLGMDVVDNMTSGMKISMFDISDKSNVTEKYKLFLDKEHNWSEALYNHKAILIDSDLNIIGFPAGESYLLYRFDLDNGFKELKEFNLLGDYYSSRAIYINNHLYLFNSNSMRSYDMDNYNEVSTIQFGKN